MGKPFSFSFKHGGKRWDVMVDDPLGMCVYEPLIFVSSAHQGEEQLDSFIHEGLHAVTGDRTDRLISRYANFLSTLLWRAGYRLQRPTRKRCKPRRQKRRP